MRNGGAVALFSAAALTVALVAGFALGAWLLLARTWGAPLFGGSWPMLVQVHGLLQLFGFAGLFVMGVALHVLPRFRAAPGAPAWLVGGIFATTVLGLVLRTAGQPLATGAARQALLVAGAALLAVGTAGFAAASLRILRSGRNPHRADELVIAAGVLAMPLAALLVTLAVVGSGSAVVDPVAEDRAVAAMLLGSLATVIFGVWARLAPGFVATPPAPAGRLLLGAATWICGVVHVVVGWPTGPWLLLAGLSLIVLAEGVFGPTIARQPLSGSARLTRAAVRSAFGWAVVGVGLFVGAAFGAGVEAVVVSAARHAIGLGFVTMMIYGVGARAIPSFLGRRLRSDRLQWATIALTDLAVALRVWLQTSGASDPIANALTGLSGLIAYAALVAFALNVIRTLRGPARPAAPADGLTRVDTTFRIRS